MHHYPFHLGDYIRATAHLDLIEDCVYRRLIDLYMETESPIPNETQQVIRRLRLGSSGLILDAILNEFFTLEDDNCWHNKRCDDEIREFRRLAEVSRINGKLGGRPKKTQQVILDNPAITQQEPVGLQPIPNTQYPSKPPISPKGGIAGFESFWNTYPKKVGKGAAEKAWQKAKINGELKTVLDAVDRQCHSDQWLRDGGQFIPNPATWINQKRWLDGEEVEIHLQVPATRLCCECQKNPVTVNTRGGICHACL